MGRNAARQQYEGHRSIGKRSMKPGAAHGCGRSKASREGISHSELIRFVCIEAWTGAGCAC